MSSSRGPSTATGPTPVRDALSPVHRRPLYEQLVERLRAHVDQAGLCPGDRLPSERAMAEQLGVSRASVRQATIVLEVQGLVEVRHGGGTFLRTELTLEPLSAVIDRQRRLPDILDAREALETKIAALAAERRTESDLVMIEDALELMASQVAAGELAEDGDRAFHAALTAAAHSSVLAQMMSDIGDDVHVSRRESLLQPNRPPQSLAQHRDIAASVDRRDIEGARLAMTTHLRSVRDVKLLKWRPPTDLAIQEGVAEQSIKA